MPALIYIRQADVGNPVAMLDKIIGLTHFLDFIDRCPFTSCPFSATGTGQDVQPPLQILS